MDMTNNIHFLSLPEHTGSQKCYVSKDLFAELKASLGEPCFVWNFSKKYLCTLWPKKDLQKKYVYLDRTVEYKLNTEKVRLDSSKNSVVLLQVGVDVLETVSLGVVLSDYSDVSCFTKNSQVLVETLKELLHFTVVAPSCIVNAERLALGKLYGIKYVILSSEETNKFDCGTIGANTELVIANVESIDRYQQRNKLRTISLGGMFHAKISLKEMMDTLFSKKEAFRELRMSCPKSVLLRGPPGTGKSSLVRMMAFQCHAYILTVTGPEILASRPGESEENLRRVFHKAQAISEEGPCILFIDEVDSFCTKKGKGSSNERRVLSQLLSLLDELQMSDSCVMLVAATNRPAELDPALRRPGRLDREIFIGIPGQTDREDILHVLLSDVRLHSNILLSDLAEATPGYVGADLKLLVQQACYNALKKYGHSTADVIVEQADFQEALHTTTPSSQKGSDVFVDHKPVKWEDIGGLQEVKSQITQFIELPIKHPEAFSRLGLPPPCGVLLYGPPGCAKTTLVRAAATSCHVTFISVSGAQLYSPFVGDSEKKISEIFQQARAGAPCILFVDELDSVVGSRQAGGGAQGGVQERVLSTLLNEMDGVGVRVDSLAHSGEREAEGEGGRRQEEAQLKKVDNKCVLFVAATNRPDKLDDAILRPGRIDRIIYVPPPDMETRRDILRVHTSKMSVDSDVDIDDIASKTEHFTGADLENLCREAAMYALTVDGIGVQCVRQEHFDTVLSTTQPSLTGEQIQTYSEYRSSRQQNH